MLAPTPTYPIHAYGAVLAGAESIPVPVGPGVDFFDSLVAADRAAEKRPKGIVVNFPANPTAAVATPELFEKIVRFAEARDLFIISDLAYGDLVFDGGRAPSMLAIPGARERTLEFMSLSKSYDMAGLARRVLRRERRARRGRRAREELPRLRAVRRGRSSRRSTALDECDEDVAAIRREVPAPPRRARRGVRRGRVADPAARRVDVRLGAHPRAVPAPRLARVLRSGSSTRRASRGAGRRVRHRRRGLRPDRAHRGRGRGIRLAAERIEAFLRKGPGGR